MDAPLIDETSYRMSGDFLVNPASALLLASFKQAMALEHKLSPEILAMPGMSGRKYRYLINNLVEGMRDPRYLEIGSWAGSTACSALFGNRVSAVCIDNWSEFGGPRDIFLANIETVRTEQTGFRFIESDFRQVDYTAIGSFNIYLFDGPHSEEDQYDGIVIAQPALDDVYVLVVDDWNWEAVRMGTLRAIEDTGTTIICSIDIRTNQFDSHPTSAAFESSEWHNGYLLAVCRKLF